MSPHPRRSTGSSRFSYTVSDGINSSTATVTVVPVPPLVKHQPPVAIDDGVSVRAGDIVTVPVLDNDYHPDSAALQVLPDLLEVDDLAGPRVRRWRRGSLPGARCTPACTPRCTRSATITSRPRARRCTSLSSPRMPSENRPPLPTPLTSRTFAGSAVKIDVPLDGLDPDGDSVVLTGITQAPALGRVVERTSTSFIYEAFAGSTGTDTFTYELRDTFGAYARPARSASASSRGRSCSYRRRRVDDAIEMKPGRTASVEVLLNDSDPSGYSLHVADMPEVDEGIEAEIRDRRRVVVRHPTQEGAYTIRYEISNGHGGADTAFLQVAVTDDAVILPPTARRPGHRARSRSSTTSDHRATARATPPTRAGWSTTSSSPSRARTRAAPRCTPTASIDVRAGPRAIRRGLPPDERSR